MLNLLRGLDRKRFTPSLYLLYREGALLEEVPDDVLIHAFWSDRQPPKWNWPGRIHGWQKADLRRHLTRERIDLTYDRLFHMAMLTGPAARGTSVARVSTIVSPPSRDLPHSDRKLLWIKKRVLRRSYREADRLLAVSQATAIDAARFYGMEESRFIPLPSPTDIERIDKAKLEPWLGPQLDQGTEHLVSIGRLSDEKGHADLLQAFARASSKLAKTYDKPLHLHLVGDGPELSRLTELTSSLGLDRSVTFHGHLSNPYALLTRCQLLCLPSLYEGLPNVLLESMVCEVPFATTNASSSIAELMSKTYRLPLAKPGQPEELADLIVDRFVSPEKWLAPRVHARRYVETNHGLNRWLGQMESLFEEAVREKRAK